MHLPAPLLLSVLGTESAFVLFSSFHYLQYVHIKEQKMKIKTSHWGSSINMTLYMLHRG